MIHQNGCLFSKLKEAGTVNEARAMFDVTASEYWDTHFRFSIEGPSKPKHLGESTADVLIINALVPLLFSYGKFHKDETYCAKALRFLEEIGAEDNTVIRHFADRDMVPQNAMQSQALLHLYNHYCRRKRCLECSIGNILLQSNKN